MCKRSISLIFILIGFLSYGLLILKMGFYWDDWPLIWNAHFQGGASAARSYLQARPFLWPFSAVSLQLMPENPLIWQLLGMLVRIGSGLAAWWCLAQVWPQAKRQVFISAVIFLIYPGFRQQWIPITYVNQLFIPLIAYMLSIGLSVRALRSPRFTKLHVSMGHILQAAGLFPTEYFLGLEFLRLAFFWLVFHQEGLAGSKRAKTSLKHWASYFLVWIVNLIWLYSFYRSPAYGYYPLRVWQATLSSNLLDLLIDFPNTLWVALVQAWIPTLSAVRYASNPGWLVPGAGLSAALLAICGLTLISRTDRFPVSPHWPRQAILLGLFAIALGRIPSWAAGLPVRLQFSWDRLTLPMMLGVALFSAGFLERVRWQKVTILCFGMLTGLAVALQTTYASAFQADWARQRDFFWQLAWRMPALSPNTILLAEDLPLRFETDNSLTAPLNWMYAPHASEQMSYALLFTSIRLGGGKLPSLEPGQPVEFTYATHTFQGSTSDIVLIYMPEKGCLKVVGQPLWTPSQLPPVTEAFSKAFALTDHDRILIEPGTSAHPPPVLGAAPTQGWCYYFERAELARQQGDWERVVAEGQRAFNQGLSPEDPSEWLPFIQAFFYSNRFSTAEELSFFLMQEQPHMLRGLCSLWDSMGNDPVISDSQKRLAPRIYTKLGCQP